ACPVEHEQEREQSAGGDCDPNYAGSCVPAGEGDVDCGEIPETDFEVVGEDVYGLDGGGEPGVACES
ncbi:MAG: nuclease, partial [Solirubrobacterales bacterium]|nr:nuclease [Solirubrobacterales bacterium]